MPDPFSGINFKCGYRTYHYCYICLRTPNCTSAHCQVFIYCPFYPGAMLSLAPSFRTGLPPQINPHSQILQPFLLIGSTNQSTSLHPVPAPLPVATAVPILLSGLIRPRPLAPFDGFPKAAPSPPSSVLSPSRAHPSVCCLHLPARPQATRLQVPGEARQARAKGDKWAGHIKRLLMA